MQMASLAQLVNASALDVLVPNTALAFPSHDISPQKWLAQLKSHAVDRRLAFFGASPSRRLCILPCTSLIRRAASTDEHLQFLLILRVQSLADSLEDPAHPPIALLSFLAHVQVSYDASYISPVSLSSSPSPGFLTPAVRISTPPRASSLKPRVHIPPNIVPPTTPNPTPLTTEHDRRYVKAEGTPLASGVWGDAKDGKEAFALLWDAATKEWVAVYSMSVNVGERSSPALSRARIISFCRSLSAHELARSFAVLDGLDDIAREAGIRHACAQAPCDPHRRSRRAPKNTRRAQRRQ